MTAKTTMLPILSPNLQVSFHLRLQSIRGLYLEEALSATIKGLELQAVDRELNRLVSAKVLRQVASYQLRGEVVFPVPIVIRKNPFLLGYYRLLYGISQKELYNKNPFGAFKPMEDAGKIPPACEARIEPLCRSLIGTGEQLVAAVDDLSSSVVHDLQLLTIGPQLRGSENTRIGQKATRCVRDIVEAIVEAYVQQKTKATYVLRNDSDRAVIIEFASDPDISVIEKLPTGVRRALSIEIKGGADASNIHNRLGEAEKSHQKAKNLGFREFWTIVNVDVSDLVARRASPTTGRVFNLERICASGTQAWREFRDELIALLGIKPREEGAGAGRKMHRKG